MHGDPIQGFRKGGARKDDGEQESEDPERLHGILSGRQRFFWDLITAVANPHVARGFLAACPEMIKEKLDIRRRAM
jgi:threonine/homoserine/homoserine lactone efflux protein